MTDEESVGKDARIKNQADAESPATCNQQKESVTETFHDSIRDPFWGK